MNTLLTLALAETVVVIAIVLLVVVDGLRNRDG